MLTIKTASVKGWDIDSLFLPGEPPVRRTPDLSVVSAGSAGNGSADVAPPFLPAFLRWPDPGGRRYAKLSVDLCRCYFCRPQHCSTSDLASDDLKKRGSPMARMASVPLAPLACLVLSGLPPKVLAGDLFRKCTPDCNAQVIQLPAQQVIVETARPKVVVQETRV